MFHKLTLSLQKYYLSSKNGGKKTSRSKFAGTTERDEQKKGQSLREAGRIVNLAYTERALGRC